MPRLPTVLVAAPAATFTRVAECLEGFDLHPLDRGPDSGSAFESEDPCGVIIEVSEPSCSLDLLRQARTRFPAAVLIALMRNAEELDRALANGADTGFAGPFEPDAIRTLLHCNRDEIRRGADATRLRRRAGAVLSPVNLDPIIGTHPLMCQLLKRVAQVAQTRSTVLIKGESGTGKELIAAAVHQSSKRRDGPFVRLNCASLAESVLESELFGHEKGAFTGAVTRREGRFKQADGGTLFVDEVSEIPPAVQVKLLRFLQEREFERVGSNESVQVDVRLVAATNRDLKDQVENGRFREDLFYRLSVVQLEVPPLRARPSDILLLAEHFLRSLAEEEAENMEGFTTAAQTALLEYPWPGNVRELRNCVEQAFVFAESRLIDVDDLPISEAPSRQEHLKLRIPGATMAEIERYAILETLKAAKGSTTKAAEILGISQRTIQYRLKNWNINPKRLDPSLVDDALTAQEQTRAVDHPDNHPRVLGPP